MAKLAAWLGLGLAALGCGGRAASESQHGGDAGAASGAAASGGGAGRMNDGGVGSSATAGAGGIASADGGAPTAGADGSGGVTPLEPRTDAPGPEGDGRLPDIPDTSVGATGRGWDLCPGMPWVQSSECPDCAAARGEKIFVAKATLVEPDEESGPHLYFYFDPPQAAAALWVDVTWLEGARSAELTLWETDRFCAPVSEGKKFDLSRLLTLERGDWSSACIPLDETRQMDGLAVRVDTAGQVGFDALRFGGPCR